MQTDEAVFGRRRIHSFRFDSVPTMLIEEVIGKVICEPLSMNSQPWKLYDTVSESLPPITEPTRVMWGAQDDACLAATAFLEQNRGCERRVRKGGTCGKS